MTALAGKTVFVTGGSGFTGGGASRAAAAGAEIVFGSLLDQALLTRELAGADIVFHCAYGMHGSLADQREVTVEGTRNLARAAASNGVKQFVHLGTVASFGGNTPEMVPEDFEDPKLWPWPYAHDKRDSERALAEEAATTALPFTILRLGAVYGPYGGSYTVMPLATLAERQIALVDNGAGIANATYVDDVIQAMLRAAHHPGTGQRYMIRGPDQPTWREFYQAYETMLGIKGLVSLSRTQMKRARRAEFTASAKRLLPETLAALKASPGFKNSAAGLGLRKLYQRVSRSGQNPNPLGARPAAPMAERPIQLIPPIMIDYFANRSRFSIAKAQAELGYAPVYDLPAGMALTEAWARWANLLPES
jgi:nucleoside-diphosphate-sugar epimerase